MHPKAPRAAATKIYVGVAIVSCVLGAAISLITLMRATSGPSGDEASPSVRTWTSGSPPVQGSIAAAEDARTRGVDPLPNTEFASLPQESAGKHNELLREIDDLSESERMEANDLAQQYALGLDVGRIVRWRPVLFDIDAVFDVNAPGADDAPSVAPRSQLTMTPFDGFELRFRHTASYQFDAGASWVGELLDADGEVTVYLTNNENDSRIAHAMLMTDLGVFNIVYLGNTSSTETPVYFVGEANRYFQELGH